MCVCVCVCARACVRLCVRACNLKVDVVTAGGNNQASNFKCFFIMNKKISYRVNQYQVSMKLGLCQTAFRLKT